MDPDSFLNLLSPELDELGDWYPSPSSSSSPPSSTSMADAIAPALPEHNNHAHAWMNPPILAASPAPPDHHHSPAQHAPYRSVLKLSDVASALLQGFSPAKPINKSSSMQNSTCSWRPCSMPSPPPPAPPVLSKHGHALLPEGTHKRSSAEASSVHNHTGIKTKMVAKPLITTILPVPAAASSPSTLAPPPSPASNSLPASPSLHPLLPEKRPSKRMKTSSLGATNTISKDSKPFIREGMSQREVHIYSERQRRKSMRESFSILQSLVPKLKLKHTDRITVLTEVIKYIRSLHGTLEELERKRSDIMSLLGISEEDVMGLGPHWWNGIHSYNKPSCGDLDSQVEVAVRVCGPGVFITLNAPKRKGVWSGVLMLLQKYNVEVVNATLATSGDNSFHCIHGKVDNNSCIESMDLQDKLERVILKQLSKQHKKN